MGESTKPTVAKPRPIVTRQDEPYWNYLRQHEFRLQCCGACGTFRFPASPLCAQCGSTESEWKRCSGRGEVFSWVVFHKSYFPGFDAELPYNVAMVRLDEGPMFIANIVGTRNEDIYRSMQVEIFFDDDTQPDLTIPRLRARARCPTPNAEPRP